jgi:stringent starvation protein B
MNSSRPYIIRALYEWIVDNGCTPYLLVDANLEDVQVPIEYVENGKIVLNVSPSAVRELSLGNEDIGFSARFGGTSRTLHFPVTAVLAVYARENGKGMMFSDDAGMQPPPAPPPASPSTKKPSLKVVK